MKQRKCVKCHRPVRSTYPFEVLCEACRKALPQCDSCGIVMAGSKYGYLETFARKVGEFSICGFCNTELRRKGYLRFSYTQKLLRDGTIKKVSPLPFAPDHSRRWRAPRPKPQPTEIKP